jgi:hypothetical protein
MMARRKDILTCCRLLFAKKLGFYDSLTYHFCMLVTLMLPLHELVFPILKYQLEIKKENVENHGY